MSPVDPKIQKETQQQQQKRVNKYQKKKWNSTLTFDEALGTKSFRR